MSCVNSWFSPISLPTSIAFTCINGSTLSMLTIAGHVRVPVRVRKLYVLKKWRAVCFRNCISLRLFSPERYLPALTICFSQISSLRVGCVITAKLAYHILPQIVQTCTSGQCLTFTYIPTATHMYVYMIVYQYARSRDEKLTFQAYLAIWASGKL